MRKPICFWHHAADPFFNMAFDDAMLAHVLQSHQGMCLRLYTWERGTITIGLHQTPEKAVRQEQLGDTPMIRRLTGGRAVFHDVSELTYSIALNTLDLPPPYADSSANSIYLQLSTGLQQFLRELGIQSQVVRRSRGDMGTVSGSVKSCFASTARYELVTGNSKIVASAQRKLGTGILQHGSIKISGTVPHPALPDLPSIARQGSQPLDRSRLEALAMAFCRIFATTIGTGELSLSDSYTAFPGLDQRVSRLRENPLLKRDLN